MMKRHVKKDPLDFVFTGSSLPGKQSTSWCSVLNQQQRTVIGPANRDWFNELSSRSAGYSEDGLIKQNASEPQHQTSVASEDDLRVKRCENQHVLIKKPIFKKELRESLAAGGGSPKTAVHISQSNQSENEEQHPSSPFITGNNTVQAARCTDPPTSSGDKFNTGIPCTAVPTSVVTPDSRSVWNHHARQASLTKMLLPTPHISKPGMTLSWSLAKSLGVDPNESAISWTSSLITPSSTRTRQKEPVEWASPYPVLGHDTDKLPGTAARMLFSPTVASQPEDLELEELNSTIEELLDYPSISQSKLSVTHSNEHGSESNKKSLADEKQSLISQAMEKNYESKVRTSTPVSVGQLILKSQADNVIGACESGKVDEIVLAVDQRGNPSVICSESNEQSEICVSQMAGESDFHSVTPELLWPNATSTPTGVAIGKKVDSQTGNIRASQRLSKRHLRHSPLILPRMTDKLSPKLSGSLHQSKFSKVNNIDDHIILGSTSESKDSPHRTRDLSSLEIGKDVNKTVNNIHSGVESLSSDTVDDMLRLFSHSANYSNRRRSAPKRAKMSTPKPDLFPLSPEFLENQQHEQIETEATLPANKEYKSGGLENYEDENKNVPSQSGLRLGTGLDVKSSVQTTLADNRSCSPLKSQNLSIICDATPKRYESHGGRSEVEVASPEGDMGMFSQISPKSLSAMCSVAENSEGSQSLPDSGQESVKKPKKSPDINITVSSQNSSEFKIQQSLFKDIVTSTENPLSSPPNIFMNCSEEDALNPSPERDREPDPFTQISPTLLDKVWQNIPTFSRRGNVKPLTTNSPTKSADIRIGSGIGCSDQWEKSSHSAPIKTLSPKLVEKLPVCQSSAAPLLKKLHTPKLKIGSTKKFFYPTNSQITKTCPKQVFDFGGFRSSSVDKDKQQEIEVSKLPRSVPDSNFAKSEECNNVIIQTEMSSKSEGAIKNDPTGFTTSRMETPRRIPPWKWKKSGFMTLTTYNKKSEETTDSGVNSFPLCHPFIVNYDTSDTADGTPSKRMKLQAEDHDVDNNTVLAPSCTKTKYGYTSPHYNHLSISTDASITTETTTIKASERKNDNSPKISENAGVSVQNPSMNTYGVQLSPVLECDEISVGMVTDEEREEAEYLLDEFGEELLAETQFTQAQSMKQDSNSTIMGNESSISEETLNLTKEGAIKFGKPPESFSGFQAASGKQIVISHDAQVNAEKSVSDACQDLCTIKGKDVDIKYQHLHDDYHKEDLIDDKCACKNEVSPLVKVETKLEKYESEAFHNPGRNTEAQNDHTEGVLQAFTGFTCASGKQILISEEARIKAEELLSETSKVQDISYSCEDYSDVYSDIKVIDTESCVASIKTEPKLEYGGFKSASGNALTISDASWNKYKTWLEDGQPQVPTLKNEHSVLSSVVASSESNTTPRLELEGFKCASGKVLKISGSSLEKYKTWLEDDSTDHYQTATNIQETNVCQSELNDKKFNLSPKHAKLDHGGFQSASGKALNVNNASLEKYKSWIEDSLTDPPMLSRGIQNVDLHQKESTLNTTESSTESEALDLLKTRSLKGNRVHADHPPSLERDWSKVPKGFRPFKPPKMIEPPMKQASVCEEEHFSTHSKPLMYALKKDSSSDEKCENYRSSSNQTTDNVSGFGGLRNLTMSQMNDVSKGLEDFLQHDSSFTQLDFTQMSNTNGKDSGDPGMEAHFVDDKYLHSNKVTLSMGGFQTASGKKFELSVAALEEARKLLDDTSHSEQPKLQDFEIDEGIISSPQHVNIAEDLEETRVKFGEISKRSHDYKAGGTESFNQHLNILQKVGLDKNLKGSSHNIRLSDAASNNNICSEPSGMMGLTTSMISKGFQTASGKAVNISEDAIDKARSLLSDNEDLSILKQTEDDNSAKYSKRNQDLDRHSSGFDTANRKTDSILESAIQRISEDLRPETSTAEQMLQPRTGEKLEKSTKIIEPGPQNSLMTSSPKSSTPHDIERCREVPSGFTPCANVELQHDISAKIAKKELFPFGNPYIAQPNCTMEKLDSSFGDELHDTTIYDKIKHYDANPPYFPGYQTASENIVSVSKCAVQKSMFVPCDPLDCEMADAENVEKIQFVGFRTAKGKKVDVSESALAKVKKLLNEGVTELPMETDGSGTSETQNVSFGQATENINIKEQWSTDASGACAKVFTGFAGFSTAGGKTVKVSDDALKKARQMWDTELDDLTPQITSGDTRLPAESLESGQPVNKISGQAHQNVHGSSAVFRDTDSRPLTNIPKFIGFHTASGATVSISESALQEAKSLLDDDQINSTPVIKPSGDLQHRQQFIGFQTGRGNPVVVSEKALAASKKLLMEDFGSDSVCHDTEGKLANDPIPTEKLVVDKGTMVKNNFSGFQTARGRKVEISTEALAASKKRMMEDMEPNSLSDHTKAFHPVKLMMDEEKTAGKHCFSGFQTAKGGTVEVSVLALAASKKLLTENYEEEPVLDEALHTPNNLTEKQKGRSVDTNCHFAGFQTARGGQVDISAQALAASKKVLMEDSEANLVSKTTNNNLVSTENPKKTDLEFSGFKTAKGGKVEVSANALAASKKLLLEEYGTDLVSRSTKAIPQNNDNNKQFSGFQTARGGKVEISVEAFAASKKLLMNDEEKPLGEQIDKQNQPTTTMEHYSGFQTDKGGKVEISAKALSSSRKLLKDDSKPNLLSNKPEELSQLGDNFMEKQQQNTPTMNQSFCGFQTAKGGKVQVSAEALTAVKGILDDNVPGMEDTNRPHLKPEKTTRMTTTPKMRLPQINQTAKENKAHVTWKIENNFHKFSHDRQKENLNSNLYSTSDEMKPSKSDINRNQTVSLDEDTIESTKALLADGDFDDVTWSPPRQWMKPVSATPEDVHCDRYDAVRAGGITSLVSAPAVDVAKHLQGNMRATYPSVTEQKHRWTGATHYKKINTPHKSRDDRTGFTPPARSNYNRFPTSHISDDKNPNPNNTMEKSTAFSTPYKTASSTCIDNNKQTPNASSSFRTPVKSAVTEINATSIDQKDADQRESDEELISDEQMSTISEIEDMNPCTNQISSMDKIVVSEEVRKCRLKAKVAQGMRIQNKKKTAETKPIPGQLFCKKSNVEQMTLKEAFEGHHPRMYTRKQLYAFGIKEATLSISASVAEQFFFNVCDYYGLEAARTWDGVKAGDGGYLVFTDDGKIDKEQFTNALMDMNGVEPKLISREWVYNHYRWIVWKLAAMEVALPHAFAGRLLTPDNVMLQLKYRYDREVDNSQRSALKKVYEQDDSPQKPMVLCVCAVSFPESSKSGPTGTRTPSPAPSTTTPPAGSGSKPHAESADQCTCELTDGWYSIPAILDRPLSLLARQGRIRVGDKLGIYGADFTGPHEACPPLQTSGVALKLSYNSTRRVRWYSKLGYSHCPQPLPLPLSSLHPEGGLVGCVDVVVTRSYPMQYLEKITGAGSVWRSERGEQKTAETFTRGQQQQLEKLYQQVQDQVQKELRESEKSSVKKHKLGKREISELQDGADIYDAITQAVDPSRIEMMLDDNQLHALSMYRQQRHDSLQSQIQEEIQRKIADMQTTVMKRNVTPVLKVRVAGCSSQDIDASITCMLTIWRPAEDVVTLLTEGNSLKIYNIYTGHCRGGRRNVTLSTCRNTRFQTTTVDDNFRDLLYEPREVADFSELIPGFAPPYTELDAVGLVVSISQLSTYDKQGGDEGSVQTIYLADADRQILAVKLWGGLNAYHIEDFVKEGVFLACSNLFWRPDSRLPWPGVTASDLTHFSTKPKEQHLQSAIKSLQNKMKDIKSFVIQMKAEISRNFQKKLEPSRGHLQSLEAKFNQRSWPADMHFPSPLAKPVVSGVNLEKTEEKVTDMNVKLKLAECNSPVTNNESEIHHLASAGNSYLAKRKAIMATKALKLEVHGLAPDIAPLNSPIPSAVRRAFKPPTPRTLAHSVSAQSTHNPKPGRFSGDFANEATNCDVSKLSRVDSGRLNRAVESDPQPTLSDNELVHSDRKQNKLQCEALTVDSKCQNDVVFDLNDDNDNEKTGSEVSDMVSDGVSQDMSDASQAAGPVDVNNGSEDQRLDSNVLKRKRYSSETSIPKNDQENKSKRRKSLRLSRK